ncbi:polysaccharide deacetylase family protein [Schlesneria paludicola]|uniref:polysaccharide deacetylase family protein n=1 Tax=Schlesneria paludicola TaxID=360056 RepID=UPI00029AB665|nr:polysaccharide deacetylase family protein [Schlesneria paludicola]
MNAIRQFLKQALTACVPRRRLLVHGPRSTGSKPRIALTFDDGPHPEHTPRLLDLLDRLALRATFFVVGQNAERYPHLLQRMSAAGHEIANHTYTHSEPRQTSAVQFLDEIQQTDRLVEQLTGRTMTTMRPPKGELNLSKLLGLWRARKTVVLWNVDPKDYRMQSVDDATKWCESYRPGDGDIVLLHDIHPYAVQVIETLATRGVFKQFETIPVSKWKRQDQAVARQETTSSGART